MPTQFMPSLLLSSVVTAASAAVTVSVTAAALTLLWSWDRRVSDLYR